MSNLPSGASASKSPKTYRVGTLCYDFRGLAFLFIWLLWGDFAFTFFENVFGRFIPIYLKNLHTSNAFIGVMTGSIAGAVNILFLPNISQWSDHHRGPLGRRIPVLYFATPLTAASLLGIGFAPTLARWLEVGFLPRLGLAVPVTTVILVLLCVFVVSFHFFNMILVNAYTWLLRDVVPQELMARFLSWFRVVGTASAFLFLWCVFPYILTRRKEVFFGVAFFYLVSFLLMCRYVREGDYPPPPSREERPGLLRSFLLYFRDCSSVPLYRHFLLVYVLGVLATSCAGPFSLLFARGTLGLSMDDMGKIFAWGSAVSAVAYFPMGWLCDRFLSMRVALVSIVALVATSILAFFLIHNRIGFEIYTVLWAIPMVGWGLSWATISMKLFPDEQFGQFSSALNVFACGALIFGNYLIGWLMDLAHSSYRLNFMWSALLFALSFYPMVLVYRGWKRHGGPLHYVPPLPSS